jgi:CheY-like chemotaxis protein
VARILFVDDDEVEQLFAREILESRGHEVVCAADGEEALTVYRSEGIYIDVVVTDLAMPRLNGLRLVRELLEIDPRVTVLAASGRNADQLDLAEGSGVAGVFFKPWDPKNFLEKLEALVEERKTEGRTLPAWAARMSDG